MNTIVRPRKKMKKIVYAFVMFLFPVVTFAAGNAGFDENGATAFIDSIMRIISKIIPLLVAVAVLIFIWGVLKYILAGSDDATKRTEARGFMIWGIIAIFVMVSVWGLVGILQKATGIGPSSTELRLPTARPGGGI